MYQRTTGFLLRLLKVPHEPAPPHGNPESLRVFRAGRNFLRLKLIGWGAAQLLAFAGIVFWLAVFIDIETEVEIRRSTQPTQSTMTVDSFTKSVEKAGREVAANGKRKRGRGGFADFKRGLAEIGSQLPPWAFPVLWTIKILGILAYFVQLPVTFMIARLDYELRWYMVTDRSLRIRHGVWKIAESTMSFANIQQVVVSQGPVQRLLGLSDVKVQSAGGGDYANPHRQGKAGEDMHSGLFHSVTNASEIRDLILDRLRRFRASGLGDPEENDHPHETSAPPPAADLLAAARELAAEARALRTTLG